MSRVIIDNRSLTRRSRNQRGSFVFTAEARSSMPWRGRGGKGWETRGECPRGRGHGSLKGRSTERVGQIKHPSFARIDRPGGLSHEGR
jgi:hypothetical protein